MPSSQVRDNALSDILNNAATAVVMAPIAVGIAERLGTASDPFLMAVAVGASCAFLTPIGHQNNALIMGPGGYEFGDYWRMGLPLAFMISGFTLPYIMNYLIPQWSKELGLVACPQCGQELRSDLTLVTTVSVRPHCVHCNTTLIPKKEKTSNWVGGGV